MKSTRIFFSTDIHGSERCFLKFVNAAKFYDVDIIILGGDITGKLIIPLVEKAEGTFTADVLGAKRVAKTEDQVQHLEKSIRAIGSYPYRTNPKEMEELKADSEKLDKLFSQLMIEMVRRWVKITEERLKGTGKRCIIMPGNDDRLCIDDVLDESDFVLNPEGKVVDLDRHHEMISTGYANMTPWNCPRDIKEEELRKKIETMVYQVQNMKNCVFNFHCPPYDSTIDAAPKLDEKLKIVLEGGRPAMIPAGSTAIRNAIESNQPLLGLHGHIHESRGAVNLGHTLCINPGSEYTEGILRGAIVILDKKSVKNYMLTSG